MRHEDTCRACVEHHMFPNCWPRNQCACMTHQLFSSSSCQSLNWPVPWPWVGKSIPSPSAFHFSPGRQVTPKSLQPRTCSVLGSGVGQSSTPTDSPAQWPWSCQLGTGMVLACLPWGATECAGLTLSLPMTRPLLAAEGDSGMLVYPWKKDLAIIPAGEL